jgi:hypothetical protein
MVLGALATQLVKASRVLDMPLLSLRLFADGTGAIENGREELIDFGNPTEAFDVLEDVAAGRLKVPVKKVKGGHFVNQDHT